MRLPIDITVHPYLLDHHVEGNVVFPAVEAMQVLAAAVKRFRPDTDTTGMTDARFDKFLYIRPETTRVAAFTDIAVQENGDVSAVLLTKSRSRKSSITRIKEHAALCFPQITPKLPGLPLDLASALEGICFEIPSDKIYRDLVPFGAAYHNIRNHLFVSKEGVIARTYAPLNQTDADKSSPLGSPFPLDASFHAACTWGQRYAGIVAFPVGVEKRIITNPTRPGVSYISRIVPVRTEPDLLIFDIWIYDDNGNLFEGACGVHMRDVSAGRMMPPQWIVDKGGQNPPDSLKHHCRVFSVIELKTLMPFAEKALSDQEQTRFHKMGEKRKRSYLAARLACKRLSRHLSGNDMHTPASEITTVCPDLVHPCCPQTDGTPMLSCSVSHDDRFAVAAASDSRVGVDVERMSERVLKARHLYMSEEEQALVHESHLGEIEAAVRIWSIKEAVTKALDITLADSWNRVQVRAVGQYESSIQIDDKGPITVVHDVVGRHVFTLVCCV